MARSPLGRSFMKVTGNYRGEFLEMRTKYAQMIARHGLSMKILGESTPNCGRIIRKISDGFSPHEFYCAVVEARAIARQGTVGTLTRALHCWCIGRTGWHLTWRVSIGISRDVQPAFRRTNDVGKRISQRQSGDSGRAMSGQTGTQAHALSYRKKSRMRVSL